MVNGTNKFLEAAAEVFYKKTILQNFDIFTGVSFYSSCSPAVLQLY